MFQWNKLELFWTSTFEVNAKGNCCNAFGTVLVVIKTNGHRLNLFIQIFNFQNIYFPKLIYVHWSCSSFKKPILTWNVVVFVVQLRKSLSLSLYLHVINSFMPLIYGLFPDVQNEDVHSVQKPEMFQYAEASIVFGVILSKRCQTMNEAQPTQTWSNKYGIQLMALF